MAAVPRVRINVEAFFLLFFLSFNSFLLYPTFPCFFHRALLYMHMRLCGHRQWKCGFASFVDRRAHAIHITGVFPDGFVDQSSSAAPKRFHGCLWRAH